MLTHVIVVSAKMYLELRQRQDDTCPYVAFLILSLIALVSSESNRQND